MLYLSFDIFFFFFFLLYFLQRSIANIQCIHYLFLKYPDTEIFSNIFERIKYSPIALFQDTWFTLRNTESKLISDS